MSSYCLGDTWNIAAIRNIALRQRQMSASIAAPTPVETEAATPVTVADAVAVANEITPYLKTGAEANGKDSGKDEDGQNKNFWWVVGGSIAAAAGLTYLAMR